MNTLILNREFAPPADGWHQIIPLGSFPATADGQTVTQRIDAEAAQAICNRFAESAQAPNFAGLLVDFDHFSLDTAQPSRAAGWITALQNRADGVYAQIRWTPAGESAIKGGEYRYCSPVFNRAECETLSTGELRPLSLLNLALTNDPNLKTLKPLTNRSTNPERPPMPNLLKLLGLPETATEAEAEAALQAKLDRLTELEASAADAQAEADLKPFDGQIENRAAAKAALLANRTQGLALLAALKKPGLPPGEEQPGRQVLPNRKTAVMPGTAADTARVADSARAAQLRNRAAEIQKAQKVPYARAWQLAEAETAPSPA